LGIIGESISSRSVIGIRELNDCFGRRLNEDEFERFVIEPFIVEPFVYAGEFVCRVQFPLGALLDDSLSLDELSNGLVKLSC